MQSYCHPSFQRDRPDLLKDIRRPSSLEDPHGHHQHLVRSPRSSVDEEAHFSSPEKKARSESDVERELEDALMMIKALGETNRQLQRQNTELQPTSPSASPRMMDDYDYEYDADEDRRLSSRSITERRSSLEDVRFILESNPSARSLPNNAPSFSNLFCFE
ncbi:hypothetical protein BASA81_000175 [Batrachochytrium salamandrivorans]|nr:hypothetical protein BASA81_000175 [Batrachochytrium salamandrivorans]